MGGIPAPDPRGAADAAAIERLFDGAADPASAEAGGNADPAPGDENEDRERS